MLIVPYYSRYSIYLPSTHTGLDRKYRPQPRASTLLDYEYIPNVQEILLPEILTVLILSDSTTQDPGCTDPY